MRVTPEQQKVLTLGSLLLAGMGLYPPWVECNPDLSRPSVNTHFNGVLVQASQMSQAVERAGNYGLLFVPPDNRSEGPGIWQTTRVDLPRLCIQWAVVLVFTALLYIAKRRPKTTEPPK